MGTCEVCGNSYDKAFSVSVAGGAAHTFDSFECAIQKLAPTCAHCARHAGEKALQDRA
ncbi:MAG TPA: hypothetical protein VFJ70_22210 [Burkholderiales bacterium]|nr:hypothetical protein [Burkholderiales bacterium]